MKTSLFYSSRLLPTGKTSIPLDALTNSNHLLLPTRQSPVYVIRTIRRLFYIYNIKTAGVCFKTEINEITQLTDRVVLERDRDIDFYLTLKIYIGPFKDINIHISINFEIKCIIFMIQLNIIKIF